VTGQPGTSSAARRRAVAALLDALPEHELRVFLAYLTGLDVQAVELPLAQFLAEHAQASEGGAAAQTFSSPGLAAPGGYLDASQ